MHLKRWENVSLLEWCDRTPQSTMISFTNLTAYFALYNHACYIKLIKSLTF